MACHPFVYGGCGGNANRFETREACESRCPPRMAQSQGTGMGLLPTPLGAYPDRGQDRILGQQLPQTGGPATVLQTKEMNGEAQLCVESPVWSPSLKDSRRDPSVWAEPHTCVAPSSHSDPLPSASLWPTCWERSDG